MTTRREFAQWLLAGATAGLAANLLPADALAGELIRGRKKPDWIVPLDKSPIQLDPAIYQRFHSQHAAFNVVSRENKLSWYASCDANLQKANREGKLCRDAVAENLLDIRSSNALRMAMDSFDAMTGGGIGRENSGAPYRNWNPTDIPKDLYENPAKGTESEFANQVKLVTKLSGADLVGIAPLNRHFVLAGTQRNPHTPDKPQNKAIVFKNVRFPDETATEHVIPESVNNAIVYAIEMNSLFVQASPAPLSTVPNSAGYGRMGIVSHLVAQFIRAMGYVAIPCKNDTVLSVPLAIEAGLGQFGRHGLLLTPEFGSSIRLGVILTNMPLVHDRPINFGIDNFCDKCMRCALLCPASCITMEDKTWTGVNECNNNGTFKWYNDLKKCLRYWIDNGHPCSTCIGVCPHTKAALLNNTVINGVITPTPTPNPHWKKSQTRRLERQLWNMDFAAYGIMDLDPNIW